MSNSVALTPSTVESSSTTHHVTELPTQESVLGIRFDFNEGCRVLLPKNQWHVRQSDVDTANIIDETRFDSGITNSSKR